MQVKTGIGSPRRSGFVKAGLAAGLVMGSIAGCAGSGTTKPQTSGSVGTTAAGSKAPGARPDQPEPIQGAVAISDLREQAISVVEKESGGTDALVRANAVEASGQSSGRLRVVIENGLNDPNLGVRSVAAATVGRARLKGFAPKLRGLLQDSSPYVRASAIGALARCGEEVDQSPLAEMLLTDPSPRVRSQAAFVIGEIGNKSALGMLKQAAGAKLERATAAEMKIMQLQIAEAMVKLGDDEQLQPIRAALYPSRPEELEAAALAVQILGQVGDKAAKGQLMKLATYKDRAGQTMPAEIRLAVAAALAKMGEKEGGFIAEEYRSSNAPAVRAQVAATYGEIGDGISLGRLREMMADQDAMVRVAAAAGALKAVGRS